MRTSRPYKYSFNRQEDGKEYSGIVMASSLRDAQRRIERVKGNSYVFGTLRIEEMDRRNAPRTRLDG